MLFSALTMAQAGGNNADKDRNERHHSRFTKVAFWRHHNDTNKNTKQAQATQAQSKPAQAKTAEIKPVSTKQAASKLVGHHPDSVKNRSQIPAVEQRQKPAASITSQNTHSDAHNVPASESKSRRRREDYIAKDTFVQYGKDGKPIH
jgi:flagellar biosynthesis GTPase FlhF